ncbi:hypothetical protein F4821DRAFT_18755 [Hypoxylon rubiginosum]|uniref:Uncharacterized protein n=1 Tax=Hypoxylon rubiginosum TaxID=110542 RepID=A0ACC0CN02_9PEZI|nr:hypothetical protein F4821DRAFT_18755 [Hypoxylon rubiginosum]
MNEFPLFTRLPVELRLAIWKFSILDHNQDRLVPINEKTKRVICITNIANPPHFRVLSESRQVARELYPIRLPVFFKVVCDSSQTAVSPAERDHVVDEDGDDATDECKGHVYVSLEYDVFVIGLGRLVPGSISRHSWDETPRGGHCNFGWRSASLSQLQCRGIGRIMLINMIEEEYLAGMSCYRTPRCVIVNGELRYTTWHDEEVFPGVEECVYVALDWKSYFGRGLYEYVLGTPGHMVMERLRGDKRVVLFNKEQMREARNMSEICLCD